MIRTPNLLQRLVVLGRNFDRRRFRMGIDVLRRAGPRMLLRQFLMHTAFRWQVRRLGAVGIEHGLPAVEDEAEGTFEFYHEGAWPSENPLVSVIIPCFNYGAFVTEAVDSVLAQTFQDLEIIVVEGGSTDATTRRTVAALHRPRMTALFRDKPCRVGDNRNFGIRHARGKYICCLDADDMLEPTYLEKALFLMETGGYDVVSASARRFGALDGGYGVMPRPDLADMLEGNQVVTCAVFRRSMWDQAGGFSDTGPDMPFIHEDWRFWVRLAAFGARIQNISGEQLFRYRAHVDPSLSTRPELLSNQQQAPLVRELNKDVITPAALERSKARADVRLSSLDGISNLAHRFDTNETMPTVLLAVPHLVLGGAERLLSEVVGGLRRSGLRIVIVTTLPTWPQLGDTTAWFTAATSEIYQLPRFLARSHWLEFVEYLIRSRQVRAMLLAGSQFFYDNIPGLKRKYPDIRIVDLLFNSVAHADSNRRIASFLDATIVEGEDVQSWLLDRGERPERICLVPSGIDLEQYRPSVRPAPWTHKPDHPDGRFVVGFSGRLAEEKAPLSFIRIATQIAQDSPIRFVMTGAGPLEEKVRARLRRGRLGERLHFAGMVADVRDYLGCYNVLVLPSILDGRPTVVMEALAMGIPVVASDVGSLQDLVVHGETGFLCKPNDLRAFATHIQFLFDHPLEYARMCVAARRYAQQHFDVERMVSGYVRIFACLVGKDMQSASPDRTLRPADHARSLSEISGC